MIATSDLAKLIDTSFKKDERTFAEHFFAQVDRHDLKTLSKDDITRVVLMHLSMTERHQDTAHISFAVKDAPDMAWGDRRTYIDIVCDDMAFLIDSVAALLGAHGLLIDLLLHPRFNVSYNAKGIAQFDPKGHNRQSHIHLVIRGALSTEQQDALHDELQNVIKDVRDATRDWQAMRLRAIETKQYLMGAPENRFSKEEISQYSEFLDYLYDNNFTFLACRSYKFVTKNGKRTTEIVKGSGLGLLSDDRFPAYISEDGLPLPQKFQEMRDQLPALNIAKVNRISTVHRRVPLDGVSVHHYDDHGQLVGETLFVGLFTSVTYSRSLRSIPVLKYKADAVLQHSGFEPNSHDGRALRHILEKYPRDELFQISVDDLKKTCGSILRLQERQRIALYTRADIFGRYVSCLVYIPRERYETRLRLKFQTILERELDGVSTSFTSLVDDSPLVRVLFTISISQKKHKKYDNAAIEQMLQDAGRLWGDALADALHNTYDDDEYAEELAALYADAFSPDYRDRYDMAAAVADIEKIEAARESNTLGVHLNGTPDALFLKLYAPGQALVLSDILPVLENMGMRVISEHPFDVQIKGTQPWGVVQDFELSAEHISDVAAIKPVFEEAFLGLMNGTYENDTLNALTTKAGLAARDVMVLRAYIRYMRQSALPYSLPYLEQALTTYPALAAQFVAYFKTCFDPAQKTRKLDKITAAITAGLEAVVSLDHDRILRCLFTALRASLRTNFYQTLADGSHKPYVSIKFDSRQIDYLPNPKPYREIFVYGTRVEGVHLRNDRIARGGIRWSDRTEDFRTEILGLVKAQTVKNSVIVPSGSKGGFIVKRPPVGGDRASIQAEGVACYRSFIRGLLDITDNYGPRNKIIKPKDVVCLDGDDPYLVVAADKGTATFSDYANALSIEYGFWLHDAFASGGSAGYDHKVMGITARGAWESVKRHFREMNFDTQTTPFDVVGVGDMAGDVFGNGMLLSPFIRLVGAFNHAHIFCDPNPDPKTTFAERQRLFKGVMGWDHYDTKLLSKGGRIYSRKDKVLDLTPEIQKRFDIDKSKVTPLELIQALLKARTDLMYLGGIGTYVKSTSETHTDAGDRSNDAVRINATDLRARVVGEGANLGFTQRARIEAAALGVRLNADFIDNSAGVDTSDHEVNIKILMAGIMADPDMKMSLAARDKFLKTLTGEIAGLVLNDNYQQTQAISLIEMNAGKLLPAHQKFMQDLERDGVLDRPLEFLPSDEGIAERLKSGKGLTRPEIGILVSYAKIQLQTALLASDVPDKTDMADFLTSYFPKAIAQKYVAQIMKHPLKREIIATVVSNMIVNRMGPTFVKDMTQHTGTTPAAVARAFVAACLVLDLPGLWASVEQLDAKVEADTQLRALNEIAILAERYTAWFLRDHSDHIQIGTIVKNWSAPVQTYRAHITSEKTLRGVMTDDQHASWSGRYKTWTDKGLPAALACTLSTRTKLTLAPFVLTLVAELKKPMPTVVAAYLPMGDLFGFSWLRTQIDRLPKNDRWSAQAAQAMQDKIDHMQMALTRSVLAAGGGKKAATLADWVAARRAPMADITDMLADIKRMGLTDLTIVMVLLQKIERLI